VAADKDVIVTGAVAVTTPHPPAAAIVYVTVYVPAALKLGLIAPVTGLSVNPAGNEV
jgi:hypothetical protein